MILFYVRLTLLLAFVRRVVISYSFTFQDCAGKSWVDCKVCGYFLPTAMSLASHILYLHPKYHKKVQESMDPSQLKKGRECICDLCDAVFSGRDGLRDHLKCRHGGGADIGESFPAFSQADCARAQWRRAQLTAGDPLPGAIRSRTGDGDGEGDGDGDD